MNSMYVSHSHLQHNVTPQILSGSSSQMVISGTNVKPSTQGAGGPGASSSVTSKIVAGGSIKIHQSQQRPKAGSSLLYTRIPKHGGHVIKRQIPAPNPYIRKWRRLKKMIKDLIFINASVCDEVVKVEEKIAKAKEERRFLLRKLLHYQSYTEGVPSSMKLTPGSSTTKMGLESLEMQVLKVRNKQKKKPSASASGGGSTEKKKAATTKELLESMQTKPKKGKSQILKKTIPPLQLDSTGRPVFPLDLGELTIHSIGEFEIAAEDNNNLVLRSNCLSDCHNLLMASINKARGVQLLELTGKGADFFGLSHPVVQYLIQSCPGSKRCSGYKWIKFEINKLETVESSCKELNDITVSYEAFKANLNKGGGSAKSQSILESTSLRSLLTSKPVVSTVGKTPSK
ncbi:hypothetical protein KUTeg_004882 [Tegillarca granosa]|uniref:Transforming growth factor beta regulator 1 n=1 Tax=Tegillarca granosa TaxID=220873 RepID=A0ABQ9FMP1_TEGGR|nr:hypothetical protein KUTeg_004882 [Tegillarca granosa]